MRNTTLESERIFAEISPVESSIGKTIYRPFFLAGLTTVLTLGCVWGAINLLAIGLNQNFSTISYSWILAHGHAMVFGFVGFFIMGFAYQMFPRFKQTNLWRPAPRLCLAAADGRSRITLKSLPAQNDPILRKLAQSRG